MGLADYVGAREDFGRFILRIAVSDLQAASCLCADILYYVVFNRRADIYIEVVAAGGSGYFSTRFFRGFGAFIGLLFLFRFHATKASGVGASYIAVLVSSVEDRLRVVVIGRATETRGRAVRFTVDVRDFSAIGRAKGCVISTQDLSAKGSGACVRDERFGDFSNFGLGR